MSDPAIPAWLQLVVTPILAAATTLFVQNRSQRDRIIAYAEWPMYYDDDAGFPRSYPAIVIQNLSARPVFIIEVFARRGPFYLLRSEWTVVDHEDPDDLHFPYKIEPGAIHTLAIGEDLILQEMRMVSFVATMVGMVTLRPRLRICVRTLAGGKSTVSGEKLISYRQKPAWQITAWWRRLPRWLGSKLKPKQPSDYDSGPLTF